MQGLKQHILPVFLRLKAFFAADNASHGAGRSKNTTPTKHETSAVRDITRFEKMNLSARTGIHKVIGVGKPVLANIPVLNGSDLCQSMILELRFRFLISVLTKLKCV